MGSPPLLRLRSRLRESLAGSWCHVGKTIVRHGGDHPAPVHNDCAVPQERSNFRDDWVAAKAKAGVSDGAHFHDLRHTDNTLASIAGASTRELMTRMGHSTTRASLIYQHMTSDRDQHIAGKLGEIIRQARGSGDPSPSGT